MDDAAPALTGVVVLTGVMAAGKSTVADLLARRAQGGVHVRGDVFRRFVVTGREEATPAMPPGARDQLLLRYRLAAMAADGYARAGFFVVWQDVILGSVLADAVAMIESRPRYVVVLDPDAGTVRAREAARSKVGYGDGWTPDGMVDALRASTPRLGAWLDTAGQTPAETVEAVLLHLDRARIDAG